LLIEHTGAPEDNGEYDEEKVELVKNDVTSPGEDSDENEVET
jgi:hypothetical protein